MAIPFFSASIITGCVLNNIEVRARLESILVLGRGWDGGVLSRKCVGWSFTTSIFNGLWDTNMTKRVAESSRWRDQTHADTEKSSAQQSHAGFPHSLTHEMLWFVCCVTNGWIVVWSGLVFSQSCSQIFVCLLNLAGGLRVYLLVWDVQDGVEPVVVLLPGLFLVDLVSVGLR